MNANKTKWTRRTYDALHNLLLAGPAQRAQCIETLTDGGMADAVAELQAADNLGAWYRMTREAAHSVGAGVVAASAQQAARELADPHRYVRMPQCEAGRTAAESRTR